MMSESKRLHPIAILFNFVVIIRHYVFAIIAGFFAMRDQALLTFILVTLGVFVLFFVGSMLSWYRFTYRVEDDELRIEHGVFIRKKRYISKNRIQSIDLTANVIHRMLKLVKVQIETAGSGDGAEASLAAVSLREGERLRDELKDNTHFDTDSVPSDHEEKKPSFKISFKRLFIAGSTSGSIGVILAVAAVGFSELEQFIPDHIYDDTIAWIISLSIILIVFIVCGILLFLWLLGIAGTMIKYGHFTITNNGEELFITRGLLEKKQITIPLKRIQAIGIKESVLRQPLGFVSVYAVVAGGSMDKGEDFPILFPLLRKAEVESFLQQLLPDYAGGLNQELSHLPKRSRKFYIYRSSAVFVIFTCIVGYFFPQFIWVPVILLLISIYFGILRYKDNGFSLEEKRLTICYRAMSKMTMIMYHNRIQAFEKSQHKIQALQALTSIQVSVIGSMGNGTHYTIKDLEQEDANHLADWYSYRK